MQDFYKRDIDIGDIVLCSGAQGELQEMTVLKLKNGRNDYHNQLFCLNDACYKKWKYARNVFIVKKGV